MRRLRLVCISDIMCGAPLSVALVLMSAGRCFSLLVILVRASDCFGAEDPVYRQFLSLVDTNDPGPQAIKSPSLVDTNNAAMKATGIVTNLAKLKEQDGIAGIRLGMTMEQVMAVWGKPTRIWEKSKEAVKPKQ